MSMNADVRWRQPFPDQLRGLALLGIVVVNVPFLALSGEGYTEESVSGSLDRLVAFLVTMLAAGKFYLIFSFLFGYSTLFILRDGSPANVRIYVRRLVALLLLGLANVVLLFIGDILVTYALLGFALMLLFGRTDRGVLRTAAIVWAVAAVLLVGLTTLGTLGQMLDPESVPVDAAMFDSYNQAMADGTFWQTMVERLHFYPLVLSNVLLGQGIFAFSAFCLGFLAARHQVLGRLSELRRGFRRCAVWGLSLGLPLQFALTWLILGPGRPVGLQIEPVSQIASVALLATAPLLSAGYVGSLALLSLKHPRALAAVAPAGRASLTVYLGESLVLGLVFCGWGLGYFGRLGAAGTTAVAIGSWAALVALIALWLRRFPQGPLETVVGRWTKRPSRRRRGATGKGEDGDTL